MTSETDVGALGARLRRIRRRAGYTLDQVAERAKVTKGYLSKIERGQATPSIAVVSRLAETYGVGLSEFFMPDGERKAISVLRSGDLRAVNRSGTELGYRYEIGDLAKADPRAEVFFLTLPCLEPEQIEMRYSHSGEEILLVLDGQMIFDYAGMELVLSKGDCIQFDAENEHYGYAIGGATARAFVVTIPRRG
ncbi:MAG: helix-turn-helix domain-containing protein [Ectothiorhodospiraceae bacterium]|nr:helix-turn-helix domain-containing protein [Ectothiorhodospiraceae bacterium]